MEKQKPEKEDSSSWNDITKQTYEKSGKPIWHVPEVEITEADLKRKWKKDEPFSNLTQISDSNTNHLRGCITTVIWVGLFLLIIALIQAFIKIL
jgi:hypothetical protein